MKSSIHSCGKCGEMFTDQVDALLHEPACLPLEVGQRVKFLFSLLSAEGRITALHPPEAPGQQATVDLETDIEITDVDMLHDGKHVWVGRDCVTKILT